MLEYVGNIEWPGFSRKIIKRHFDRPIVCRGSITEGRKISEGVYPPYMREDEEARLLSWGSFFLLLLVLDLCYALGKGGVATITDGRNIREGVPTIYVR